jgi:hypothetical protein
MAAWFGRQYPSSFVSPTVSCLPKLNLSSLFSLFFFKFRATERHHTIISWPFYHGLFFFFIFLKLTIGTYIDIYKLQLYIQQNIYGRRWWEGGGGGACFGQDKIFPLAFYRISESNLHGCTCSAELDSFVKWLYICTYGPGHGLQRLAN